MRGGPHLASKRCIYCRKQLRFDQFYIDNKAEDGRQSYCIRCKANATREGHWRRYYNLLPGRAYRCWEIQGGKCPVCELHLEFGVQVSGVKKGKGVPRGDILHVDHCHESGEVRGLLHGRCNTSPPKDGPGAARWAAYCENPPMRQAHDGILIFYALGGFGNAQLPLLEREPPCTDIAPKRREPHPKPKAAVNA